MSMNAQITIAYAVECNVVRWSTNNINFSCCSFKVKQYLPLPKIIHLHICTWKYTQCTTTTSTTSSTMAATTTSTTTSTTQVATTTEACISVFLPCTQGGTACCGVLTLACCVGGDLANKCSIAGPLCTFQFDNCSQKVCMFTVFRMGLKNTMS